MLKYYIVSDIHSQFDLLLQALLDAGFDMENESDILVIAGDILDRGKQGDSLILFLELLIRKKRILAAMGNHDKYLCDILNQKATYREIAWNIEHNGFAETLLLGLSKSQLEEIYKLEIVHEMRNQFIQKYPVFAEWILTLPKYIEFPHHIIVHGFIDFSLKDWHDTSEKYAMWERGYKYQIPTSFTKKIIFGHTPNEYISGNDDIIYENQKIMIDGGAAMNHQINVLCLTEEQI